jgi:ketosteroid isomerase-like protein
MPVEPAPEVEQLIRELVAAIGNGEVEAIERTTSADPSALVIGSDATEVARGRDEIVAMMRGEMDARAGEASPRWTVDTVEAHRDGDVAWATVIGPFRIEGGTLDARGSGVLRREDGEWRIIQFTASLLVRNEAIEAAWPEPVSDTKSV